MTLGDLDRDGACFVRLDLVGGERLLAGPGRIQRDHDLEASALSGEADVGRRELCPAGRVGVVDGNQLGTVAPQLAFGQVLSVRIGEEVSGRCDVRQRDGCGDPPVCARQQADRLVGQRRAGQLDELPAQLARELDRAGRLVDQRWTNSM
jgi:hypothetical protein